MYYVKLCNLIMHSLNGYHYFHREFQSLLCGSCLMEEESTMMKPLNRWEILTLLIMLSNTVITCFLLQLEMENDDVIEVYQEQTGGY